MRRNTPHLGNLLSANQFFDTLKAGAGHSLHRLFLCPADQDSLRSAQQAEAVLALRHPASPCPAGKSID